MKPRFVNQQNIDQVLEYINNTKDVLAYDIETNGNRPEICKIIGFAFTNEIDNGWYLPTMRWNTNTKTLEDIPGGHELAIRVVEALSKKDLIMHNAPFDVVTTWNYFGINLTDALLADTILMKHTLDENSLHGLEACVKQYQQFIRLRGEYDLVKKVDILHASIKKNGGKTTKKEYELYKAELDVIAEYAIADVYLTLRLFNYFEKELKKTEQLEFFYDKEVMPTCKHAIIPMKKHGVPIDIEYFKQLKVDTVAKIEQLKREFFLEVGEVIQPRIDQKLEKLIKTSRSGGFAKAGLEYFSIPVPTGKNGKPTFSKTALTTLRKTTDHTFVRWLNGEIADLEPETVLNIKRYWYDQQTNQDAFNIASGYDLSWLLFDFYKCEANPDKVSKKTGKASVDKNVLAEYAHLPFVEKILQIRKEEKILSTYIDSILERSLDGRIYPTFQQFGTTSGRFSCKDPNFQNLPAKDTRIKAGIKAPEGYSILNSDFASVEPRIFSWVTQDEGLLKVWNEDRDLYSYLAIVVLGALEGIVDVPKEATDNPKDENYLKKIAPKVRDVSKTFVLSVPYGNTAFNMDRTTGWGVDKCQELIDTYLEMVPGLAQYMKDCEYDAITDGFVKTKFGRVRHIPEAKMYYEQYGDKIFNKWQMACATFPDKELLEELTTAYKNLKNELKYTNNEDLQEEIKKDMKEIRDEIYKGGSAGCKMNSTFKNILNNSKNAKIQGTAAHIANASMVKFSKLLKKHNIDGWLCMQVHDEITAIIRDDHAELAAKLLQESMEKNWVTKQINLPITAEPLIAKTLDQAK